MNNYNESFLSTNIRWFVLSRPQVLTEEKMDYDVYSKYPLRMPNRNKTIEVYKMLGHKFPTVSLICFSAFVCIIC